MNQSRFENGVVAAGQGAAPPSVCRLMLFDLDGTLVDTARDLHAAANRMRQRRGLDQLPFAPFRPLVSRGGLTMLGQAFPRADSKAIAELLPEFLACYGESVAALSCLFPGMAEVLVHLEELELPWGVVTNKPEGLARDVLRVLGLEARCAVLIGGDTLAVRKPDPAPLLEACRRLSIAPTTAVYVGDDPRDVEAAQAANMPCIAAAWGYLNSPAEAALWSADAVADSPDQLIERSPLSIAAAFRG